jgi:hypothetical protein
MVLSRCGHRIPKRRQLVYNRMHPFGRSDLSARFCAQQHEAFMLD